MEKGPLPAGLREVLQSGKMELKKQEIHRRLNKGKGPSPEGSPPKKPRRRPCGNCGRNLLIAAHDRCFTCERAAGKLKGEALTAALVEIKRRVDAGEIVRGAVRGPRRKSTALIVDKSFTPAPTPKVEGTAKKDPASGAIDAGSPLGNSPKVEGLSAALESVRAEGASPEATALLVFSEAREQALYSVLLDESVRCRPGKYEEIGADIGRLVDKKQKAYGRSFETCEKALLLLCPDKIIPDQYGLVLAFARSWDKWSRLFSDPTAFGEQPRPDLAGYALLMNKDYEVAP